MNATLQDPCVNVVLLEDLAAVLGVVVAGSCMSLAHYTGSYFKCIVLSSTINPSQDKHKTC